MIKTIIIGIYQHYKGQRYEVLFIAKNSETREEMVVYRALYGDFHFWVRLLDAFLEEIEYNGVKQPRFKLLQPSQD